MIARETRQERRALQRRSPEAFKDGMQSGAGLKGYPPGFADWPLDRRNAWWAGANLGYLMAHPQSRGGADDE
jgi:hypothetical protein